MTSHQETRVKTKSVPTAMLGITAAVALAATGCRDIDPVGPAFARADAASIQAASPGGPGFTPASGTAVQTGVLGEEVRFAGPNTIVELTVVSVISGTLNGTVEDRFTLVIHPNGKFTAQGTAICECTVDGKAGTVEMRATDAGAAVEGVPRFQGRWVILGVTGELSGLRGVMQFEGAVDVATNLSTSTYSGWIRFLP